MFVYSSAVWFTDSTLPKTPESTFLPIYKYVGIALCILDNARTFVLSKLGKIAISPSSAI